ncbi:hypothetical protein ACWDRR_35955 [Kitasatospora sp. NPDC003701]
MDLRIEWPVPMDEYDWAIQEAKGWLADAVQWAGAGGAGPLALSMAWAGPRSAASSRRRRRPSSPLAVCADGAGR